MTLGTAGWKSLQPQLLALLRIMTALLFMQHGMQKLFGFPNAGHHSGPLTLLSWVWIAGVLEFGGGLLVALGLWTRITAFILAGEMAVAYFMVYFPQTFGVPGGFFPVVNGGELASMFCFVFLYLSASGPGAWALSHDKAE